MICMKFTKKRGFVLGNLSENVDKINGVCYK